MSAKMPATKGSCFFDILVGFMVSLHACTNASALHHGPTLLNCVNILFFTLSAFSDLQAALVTLSLLCAYNRS